MVCEWPVTLVGCKIYGKYIWEESESINSFVPACLSYFNKSTLKSPSRKTFLFSFKTLTLTYLIYKYKDLYKEKNSKKSGVRIDYTIK